MNGLVRRVRITITAVRLTKRSHSLPGELGRRMRRRKEERRITFLLTGLGTAVPHLRRDSFKASVHAWGEEFAQSGFVFKGFRELFLGGLQIGLELT